MATEDKGSMSSNSDPKKSQNKSRWDWFFQILRHIGGSIALIALIVGGIEFYVQQQQAQQQALDQQRQMILDTYLDRMSDLLLMYHLGTPQEVSGARAIAQARTYTALRNLDGRRKGTLIRFLWGASLINEPQPILSLKAADVSGAIFDSGRLEGADLSGADLSGADLRGVHLCGTGQNGKQACADLSGAYLNGANLSGATLSCVDLGGGKQACADLSGVHLCGTELNGQKVCADLSGAYLDGANLSGATLGCVDLGGGKQACADLSGAYLDGANLSGATLSGTILSKASYNAKTMEWKDIQGNPIILQPTQWPPGFDPNGAGAICVVC